MKAIGLDAMFAGQSHWVSLHSADPGLTGANEISGNAYGRVLMEFPAAGGDAVAENTNQETFGPATPAGWGTVTHWGIWTAGSGGTYRGGFALTTPRPIGVGEPALFAIGALTVTFPDPS